MRFMIIVKASKESEAGATPTEEMLTEMGKFNEELVKAGVMLAAAATGFLEFKSKLVRRLYAEDHAILVVRRQSRRGHEFLRLHF